MRPPPKTSGVCPLRKQPQVRLVSSGIALDRVAHIMECTVRWVDGMAFMAETESGHAFVMDGAPEGGGRNLGPRPMETVLAGTGGCTIYDVLVILKKSGQQVTGGHVQLQAERAETDPKVFTRIHMHFVIRGRAIKPALVESAIKLSHHKYCSASIMLGKTADITHDYEIIEEA